MESWKRLEQVISYSELSINAFAGSIGLKRSENLYQIKRGKNAISKDLASLITKRYGNISKSWLLTGEGSMLKTEEKKSGLQHCTVNRIPFYDSINEPFKKGARNEYPLPLYYIEIPILSNCDFAITCVGDSMAPEITSGSIITLKETGIHLILPGEMYFIVTENFSTIKYLRTVEGDDTLIRLVPANKENYDEATIPKELIQRVFLVKGVISAKVL